MTRRAILLIGTEKTGTTTLQRFFSQNRARLVQNGFYYPSFCGGQNHTGLAAYALAADKEDVIRQPFGYGGPGDLAAMRARIEAAARKELEPVTGTVLFCSEHCHSRLTTPPEIETLKALLDPHFDEIEIAVYLRRQDQVALSLYATQMKSGVVQDNLLSRTWAHDPYYNYDVSLRRWSDVFGAGHLTPRIFDRASLGGGSVVSDFCATWGIGAPEQYLKAPDSNASIAGVAVEFLRHANADARSARILENQDVRGMLVTKLEELFPGRGPRPSREEAWAFYGKFRPSNELLRQRYFPDRATLFDESFDMYPEVADPRDLPLDDAIHVALRMHEAMVLKGQRYEAEIALRDGRIAWLAQRPAEALAHMRRAIELAPDHAELHRTFAEHLFRAERFAEAANVAKVAAERRPMNAEYWHFLGIVQRKAGDPAAAIQSQERALQVQPDFPGAQRELETVTSLLRRETQGS